MMNELKLRIARWLLRSPDVRALVYDIVVECDDFGDTVADIAEKVAEDVVQEAERDREPTLLEDFVKGIR